MCFEDLRRDGFGDEDEDEDAEDEAANVYCAAAVARAHPRPAPPYTEVLLVDATCGRDVLRACVCADEGMDGCRVDAASRNRRASER